MEADFLILGGVLSIVYNHLTTTKKEYKELKACKIIISVIVLFSFTWFGLVVSIALDIMHLKSKIKKQN